MQTSSSLSIFKMELSTQDIFSFFRNREVNEFVLNGFQIRPKFSLFNCFDSSVFGTRMESIEIVEAMMSSFKTHTNLFDKRIQ